MEALVFSLFARVLDSTVALAANTFFSESDLVTHFYDVSIQTYALSLLSVAVIAFTSLAGFTMLCCLVMLAIYLSLNPNILAFPQVTFSAKMDASMRNALEGLSNGTSYMILEKFADVKVKVGE